MISYLKFKELFDKLDSNCEPEIGVYFKNKKCNYMIIKYNDFISFQSCGKKEEKSGEIKFNSLDELYNNETIDNIALKNEWNNIEDILINSTFSVVDDKEDISDIYGIAI